MDPRKYNFDSWINGEIQSQVQFGPVLVSWEVQSTAITNQMESQLRNHPPAAAYKKATDFLHSTLLKKSEIENLLSLSKAVCKVYLPSSFLFLRSLPYSAGTIYWYSNILLIYLLNIHINISSINTRNTHAHLCLLVCRLCACVICGCGMCYICCM